MTLRTWTSIEVKHLPGSTFSSWASNRRRLPLIGHRNKFLVLGGGWGGVGWGGVQLSSYSSHRNAALRSALFSPCSSETRCYCFLLAPLVSNPRDTQSCGSCRRQEGGGRSVCVCGGGNHQWLVFPLIRSLESYSIVRWWDASSWNTSRL